MAACQRAGEWERVLTLLSRMEGDGYGPPDLASYEIVMSACLRAKAWDRVPGILVRMEESGARPDAHFVEWVMKALAVEGQWAIAVDVLESLQHQAQAQGSQLSNVVYNLAIKVRGWLRFWIASSTNMHTNTNMWAPALRIDSDSA